MKRSKLDQHASHQIVTESTHSPEASRKFILNALELLIETAHFSKIRYLNESIPNIKSHAQDRGPRLTHVVEGRKGITYANDTHLKEDVCNYGTTIYAKANAWQSPLYHSRFKIIGIAIERSFTRFLWVDHDPDRNHRLDGYYYHTQRPSGSLLSSIAESINVLLSQPDTNSTVAQDLMHAFWTTAYSELKNDAKLHASNSIPESKWIAIHQYIIENLSGSLHRSHLSATFGISENYISKLFKRYSDLSLSKFILKVRLEHARDLLLHSHSSVSEIAYRSGFNDVSYFTRAFKNRYGQSPNQLRKQVR